MSRGAVLAGAIALLGLAPSAAADVFVGAGGDPRGDQVGGAGAGADVTGVSLTYDDAVGGLSSVVTLAGPATGTPADLSVVAGRRTDAGACQAPFAGFFSPLDGPTTQWIRDDDGESPAEARGFATRRLLARNRVLLSFEGLFLRGLRYDCLQVSTDRAGRGTFDTTAVFALTERPPAPSLRLTVTGLPRKLRRGRSVNARVRITNLGDAPATEVRLSVGRARGLRAKLARRYFTLVPVGRSVPTTLRLRLTGRARRTTKVGLAARASLGPRARTALTLRR